MAEVVQVIFDNLIARQEKEESPPAQQADRAEFVAGLFGYRRLMFALIAEEWGVSHLMRHLGAYAQEVLAKGYRYDDPKQDAALEMVCEILGGLTNDIERAIDRRHEGIEWSYDPADIFSSYKRPDAD